MKLLVTLAICAVCVSGESLSRQKRGWGYETTTQGWGGWTQRPTPPPPPPPTQGWGWTEKPGWGQPQPTQGWGWGQQPTTSGWGYQPPTSGWGNSGGGSGWGWSGGGGYNYPGYSRYPRPWGGNRYGRDSSYRNRSYRDTIGSRRSSLM